MSGPLGNDRPAIDANATHPYASTRPRVTSWPEMKLFQIYRYPKPSPGPDIELIDGYPNIFNATRWPAWPGLQDAGRVQLDHGIDSVTKIKAADGIRRPAILIASKPHQARTGHHGTMSSIPNWVTFAITETTRPR